MHASGDEVLVLQMLGDDHVGHRVEQRHVRARARGEMHLREVRQLDRARVDHDQPGTAADGLPDARADDRMVLGRVGAAHENGPRRLDIVEGVGGRARPEHRLERRGARRVADAGAAVDVVGADDDPRELLREVVLFVGRAGGAKDADAVGSESPSQVAEPLRDEIERLVPRRHSPRVALPDQRIHHAIGSRGEVEGVAALHAHVAPADGRGLDGCHLRDRAIARADLQLAAGPAVRARRARPDRRRPPREHGRILERAARTGVDTRTATHATALGERRAIRANAGFAAPLPDAPHRLSLQLVADAHAAVAVDAP